LEIMAGPDKYDATTAQDTIGSYSQPDSSFTPKKIAYFKSALEHPSIDPEIQQASFSFLEKKKKQGHEVTAVDFDLLDYLVPAYYVLTTAEASANLSRYDGVRFGYRSEDTNSLKETYNKTRTEGFGTEVKRRILLGAFVLSSGYYDAYYRKAQKVRRLIFEKTKSIFQYYDFLVMPVTPTVAWRIGEKSDDPVAAYLEDIFTVQANMCGIPAIAIPLGKNKEGLPFGIQVMADQYKEKSLFKFLQVTQI